MFSGITSERPCPLKQYVYEMADAPYSGCVDLRATSPIYSEVKCSIDLCIRVSTHLNTVTDSDSGSELEYTVTA